MSLIVSASQRCSAAVTDSMVVMGAGLRACKPGVKGIGAAAAEAPFTTARHAKKPPPF